MASRHAELRLLHVLDANGIGSADRLLAALDQCLELAQRGTRRVVVNLSLYLLIPPDDAPQDLWDVWFAGDPDYAARTRQENAGLLERLDEPFEQRIALLLDAGAVVVAAAGNDALVYGSAALPTHLQPRLPADYDSVLCVVAADQGGHITAYSNRADAPMTGNCVATLGGQGVMRSTTAGAANTSTGEAGNVVVSGTDGVVGLYTQPDVSVPNDNRSGWVYWSGTSFATPIVSGIAANVLARNELARQESLTVPRLTPRGVMTRLLAMGVASDAALGCPYVPVKQQQ